MSRVLEMVRNATPAEKAEVLAELMVDSYQTARGVQIIRFLTDKEGDGVICIPITRTYPPPAPPVLTAEEQAEITRRIKETNKHIPIKDVMKLIDQMIVEKYGE